MWFFYFSLGDIKFFPGGFLITECYRLLIFAFSSTLDIGLPSGKSLFQLQAERILCVQRLAAQSLSDGKNYLSFTSSPVFIENTNLTVSLSAGTSASVPIHWYIMTSPFTDEATRKFFESHKYFGLEADQVKENLASLYSSFCFSFHFWWCVFFIYRSLSSNKVLYLVFQRMGDLLWRLHSK